MSDDNKNFLVNEGEEGFVIVYDESGPAYQIKINGTYAVFVNGGSQYAIWNQFPRAIQYTVKDLDSGEVHVSINNELSISPHGNQIYDSYSKRPCDKVVAENFSVVLNHIYFINPPTQTLNNIEVSCSYYGHPSNTIKILDRPIQLKGF